jgi:hypothetical protein
MLSRSVAADLIKSTDEFKQPSYSEYKFSDVDQLPIFGPLHDAWMELEKQGMVSIKGGYMGAQVSWTDKGRALRDTGKSKWKKCKPDPWASGECWMPLIGTPALLEITGVIQETNSAEARAEFTWKLEPSEFARVANVGPRGVQKGTAVFKRYDDGWRVESM